MTKITHDKCAEIHRLYGEATLGTDEIGDRFGATPQAVLYHLHGKCSHDVEPASIHHGEVSPDECAEMHRLYREGLFATEVADFTDYSRPTVHYHLRGHCTHDVEPLDLPRRTTVTADECASARRMAAEGHSDEEIEEDLAMCMSLVKTHRRGTCEHEIDVPPHRKRGVEVTADMCVFMRYHRHENRLTHAETRERVREFFELAESEMPCTETVQRHALFRCGHE